MEILLIYLGSFYILLGIIFLFIPLIYLELGKPYDLIRAAANLFIGTSLIIKNKVFEISSILTFIIVSVLVFFYVIEIFSFRWNQLTDKEKNQLKTLGEFKKNLTKISEAINLGFRNLKESLNFLKFKKNKESINTKKWVRNDINDKSDNIKA